MESSAPSCWSCGASHGGAMICTQCEVLQAPGVGLNPFEVLGLPVRVLVDDAELAALHLRLTRKLHPDFFGDASPAEQAHSLEWSSRVNDAYRALRSLQARAGQVLAVHGRSMDTTEGGWRPPQTMLLEVFEINEGLDTLQEGPVATGAEALERWESTVQGWKEQVMEGMVSRAEAWDTAEGPAKEAVLDALQEVLARSSYVENLRGRIERVRTALAESRGSA